jgi:hypothetical protein
MSPIDLFFQSPNNFDDNQDNFSTLFALRRDIYICMGINPNDNATIESRALFPAAMAIMAGIDLLAKFVYFLFCARQRRSNM